MKKTITIFLILALFASFTFAASDLNVNIASVVNTVTPIQNATYAATLTNNLNRPVDFEFRYLDIDWVVFPEKVTVPAQSTKNQLITFVPQPPYTDEKPKVIKIIVDSDDKTYRQDFLLDINLLKYKNILDQSSENLIVPDPIDPRKPTVINVKLNNLQNASLDNVNVKLSSQFFEENKVVSIYPNEITPLDFNIELKKDTVFGAYPINLLVTFQNRVMLNITDVMKIGNYPDVGEEKNVKTGFLYNLIEITKTNNGNSVSHEKVSRKITTFQGFFTKTVPMPSDKIKQGSDNVYVWNLDLQPGESKNITIETDYRLFFGLIVFLVILVIAVYLLTKRDILIRKRLVSIKKEDDGSSTIKISITVKNKGFAKLMNVKVMDKIPRVVEMPHEFGTAHPRVVEHPQGAQLIWEIMSLGPGEERIFSYKARSKLQIIGKATIPSAVAKYGKGNRILTVSSNPEQLLS